jgi:hypothetical protein
MVKIRENIQDQLPFISVLHYGGDEYVGVIINQDQYVTSFYDLGVIRTPAERTALLETGEIWWWESNRQLPINIFLRKEVECFKYAIKTFNSKDVKIIMGPVVSLSNLSVKRVKRKNLQLVRNVKPPE